MRESETAKDYVSDPAAIFACALSIWNEWENHEGVDFPLSMYKSFDGMDQFMREAMRVGGQFETWACEHIEFNSVDFAWPYLLKEQFGETCLATIFPRSLTQFDTDDCLRVALKLRLPIKLDERMPIPVDVTVPNSLNESYFKEYRIQTVRDSVESEMTAPFTQDDDPFDAEFEAPYYGLYGVGADGLLEHIADRKSYSEVVKLAEKLVPGIKFPITPSFTFSVAQK